MVLGSPALKLDEIAANVPGDNASRSFSKLALIAGSVLVCSLFVGGILAYAGLSSS